MKPIAQTFQITRRGRRVLVLLGGELAAAHSSGAARELARVLRATAERATLVAGVELPPQSVTTGRFRTTVRYDGNALALIFERGPQTYGFRLLPSEYGAVASGLHAEAGLVEEWEQAPRIARDHAILLRVGSPIGLSSNPVLQAEAKKAAEGDRDLRRYIPQLKATRMTGTPIIFHETRSPLERARDAAARMSPADRSRLLKELTP